MRYAMYGSKMEIRHIFAQENVVFFVNCVEKNVQMVKWVVVERRSWK